MENKKCNVCGKAESSEVKFRLSSKKFSKKKNVMVYYYSSKCIICERNYTSKRIEKLKLINPDYWKTLDYSDKVKKRKDKRFFWYKSSAFKTHYKSNISTKELSKFLFFKWKNQKGLCAITGRKLDRSNAWIDHIEPRTKGGTNDLYNLRWTVKEANKLKNNFTKEEFEQLIFQTLSHEFKSKFQYFIACAIQDYDEEFHDYIEGNYTSFSEKFINKLKTKF